MIKSIARVRNQSSFQQHAFSPVYKQGYEAGKSGARVPVGVNAEYLAGFKTGLSVREAEEYDRRAEAEFEMTAYRAEQQAWSNRFERNDEHAEMTAWEADLCGDVM